MSGLKNPFIRHHCLYITFLKVLLQHEVVSNGICLFNNLSQWFPISDGLKKRNYYLFLRYSVGVIPASRLKKRQK